MYVTTIQLSSIPRMFLYSLWFQDTLYCHVLSDSEYFFLNLKNLNECNKYVCTAKTHFISTLFHFIQCDLVNGTFFNKYLRRHKMKTVG